MMRPDDDGGSNNMGTMPRSSAPRRAGRSVGGGKFSTGPGATADKAATGNGKLKTTSSTGANAATHDGDWNSTMGAKITRDK